MLDHTKDGVQVGHQFDRITYKKREKWTPFMELTAFLAGIMNNSEKELVKVLEALAEKTIAIITKLI